MPPRKPAYRSMATTALPPDDLPLPLPMPVSTLANLGACYELGDELIEAIEDAMSRRGPLTPIDAIAAQVYVLAMTIAASHEDAGAVLDTLASVVDGLRRGVIRCRERIAEDGA
jgi:hypothetical protein